MGRATDQLGRVVWWTELGVIRRVKVVYNGQSFGPAHVDRA